MTKTIFYFYIESDEEKRKISTRLSYEGISGMRFKTKNKNRLAHIHDV